MKEKVMIQLEREIETVFVKEIIVDGIYKKIFAYKITDFYYLGEGFNYPTREGLCFEEDLPKIKNYEFNVSTNYHLYNQSIDMILRYSPLKFKIQNPCSFLLSQQELCPGTSFDGEIVKFNYKERYLLDQNGRKVAMSLSLDELINSDDFDLDKAYEYLSNHSCVEFRFSKLKNTKEYQPNEKNQTLLSPRFIPIEFIPNYEYGLKLGNLDLKDRKQTIVKEIFDLTKVVK